MAKLSATKSAPARPCLAGRQAAGESGGKIKKVYLPRWQRWLVVPLFGGFWIFITYLEFFDPNVEKLGLVGYIFMSALFLGMGVVMWLMASGKLPSAIIKEED